MLEEKLPKYDKGTKKTDKIATLWSYIDSGALGKADVERDLGDEDFSYWVTKNVDKKLGVAVYGKSFSEISDVIRSATTTDYKDPDPVTVKEAVLMSKDEKEKRYSQMVDQLGSEHALVNSKVHRESYIRLKKGRVENAWYNITSFVSDPVFKYTAGISSGVGAFGHDIFNLFDKGGLATASALLIPVGVTAATALTAYFRKE